MIHPSVRCSRRHKLKFCNAVKIGVKHRNGWCIFIERAHLAQRKFGKKGPMKSRVFAMSFAAICLAPLAACSSSSTSSSSSSATGERGDNDITAQGGCPLHGAISLNSAYPLSALPTGSCSVAGTCDVNINPCCDPREASDVDEYECECKDGHWQCVDKLPGEGTCQNTCTDAGPDSST